METLRGKWVMQEKRKFPRADLVFSVEYRPLKEEQPHTGLSRDLSMGGVSFRTDVPLEKGVPVVLSFSFPELDGAIQATGRVVRVWEEEGHNYAAMKFTAIHQDDLSILQNHLEQYFDAE